MCVYSQKRGWKVTCRPLLVYTKLDDKIILALKSRYLARYFNRYLHENILSYRAARDFQGEKLEKYLSLTQKRITAATTSRLPLLRQTGLQMV